MKRIIHPERKDWKEKAASVGFDFHEMYGKPYWDETSYYQFTLRQIEDDIEDPASELHHMCMQAVNHIVQSDALMLKMGIPVHALKYVKDSFLRGEPHLYGRFDLVYDGKGPAKMLEYNADTPTSLFESVSFQYDWLQDNIESGAISAHADQFNSVYEGLVSLFGHLFKKGENIHFASFMNSEDYATVETLAYAAKEAGLVAWFTEIEKIGITDQNQFADDQNRVIGNLFKLYPWEDIFQDDFFQYIEGSRCKFIEPAWKSLVSNKGILPVLWKLFPGHKNLLPAFFEDEYDGSLASYVKKPIFSREGSSITIVKDGEVLQESENMDYAHHTMIVQEYCELPDFDGNKPIIGAWIVGDECRGMGIREDEDRITQNLSRFKPHVIMN